MQRIDTDILVSGAGIAGMAAAAAFAAAGFAVVCVDPAAPVTAEADPGADLRTTAILTPSVPVLAAAGLWDRLAPHAAPLQLMRIVEAGDAGAPPRVVKSFAAAELGGGPFGWNLPNWLIRREMAARLAELPGLDFRPGTATAAVTARTGEAIVRLSDGARVRARLIIAADGRDSPLRAALGIGVRTIRYGQKAVVFAVTHPLPHDHVSTEIHRSGGPFTLVPLPDRDGTPASAVVWMERGPEALRLAALPVPAFEAEASARSCEMLGPLRLATARAVWPIITQAAERMVGPRSALMAEAAHVVPPIGAQGLNMSLADLSVLLDLARKAPAAIGEAAMLAAYARARRADVLLRLAGIDLLNRASMAGAPGLRELRAGAIGALHAIGPVRRALMRTGLGLGAVSGASG
jgi:2-octaprenyl-6-methoxyphenol hydroxylase